MKILGVTFDFNLNWEEHISKVTKLCTKMNMGFRLNRATPIMITRYVQAMTLLRILTSQVPKNVYLDLLQHHVDTRRYYKPSFITNNSSRVGLIIFRNRIQKMCNQISKDIILLLFNQLKICAKTDFLIFNQSI